MVHPNSVNQVKSDDKILRSEVLQHVLSYLILYLGLVIASFLLISLDDMDFGTAVSAVSTCINNIGPGHEPGRTDGELSFLSDFSKIGAVGRYAPGTAGNFPHPHSSRPVGYTNAKSLLEGIKEVFRMVIDKIALALAIIGA
mgnify:CR=1 FL=1